MDPGRAAEASVIGRTVRHLESLFPYMNDAGRAYLHCSGRYADYPHLYDQTNFFRRVASDLRTKSPNAIEREYWTLMHRVFSAALSRIGKNCETAVRTYESTIGSHQRPNSDFPKCNGMRPAKEAEYLLVSSGRRALRLVSVRSNEPKDWHEIATAYKDVVEAIDALYIEVNNNLATFERLEREKKQARNLRISLGLAVVTFVLAAITAWSEFGPKS